MPLANSKGPVETTGTACKLSDNGSGNGDSGGSGTTPDEGSSGTKPIDGWLDFEPVIGDATGTSVSGAVAKLNKNLGGALRQVVDSTKQDSNNINSITHSAESFARDMKTALYHLDRLSSDSSRVTNSVSSLLGSVNTASQYLQSIDSKTGNSSGSSGETGTPPAKEFNQDRLFGALDSMRMGSLNNIDMKLNDTNRYLAGIEGALGSNGMAGNIYAMRQMMEKSGSGSGESGQGIDYSKMPGSSGNPLAVRDAGYKSVCSGDGCFFDVPAMDKKLAETNESLADKYASISEDVKQVFSFSLTGSAEPMECLDLFSFQGKDYTVCPPSGDYWKTLAALMMFIFYFVALMIIFKR